MRHLTPRVGVPRIARMHSSSSTPPAAEEADDDQADAASAELAACLARVALGERAAFRDLYTRTSAHLMGVAFALLHQHEATIAAFAPSPDTPLHQAAQRARLDGALQPLAPQQRLALALVLYRGLSYPEVAAHAGVPLPTATAWIRRGLERLRGRLDAAGPGQRACA